jgi:thiol-disulfide isomerase/thioredoxin
MEPPKSRSWLIIVVPILVILGGAYLGLSLLKDKIQKDRSERAKVIPVVDLKVGAVLPDFELDPFLSSDKPPEGEGPAAKLLSFKSLPHKVVLINFWATWCSACIEEMPSIVKLREKFKDRGFEVLGVNVDEKPELVVPSMVTKLKMNFPLFVDRDGTLSEFFDVHAIPLSILLTNEGKVLLVESGDRDWFGKDIQKLVETHL